MTHSERLARLRLLLKDDGLDKLASSTVMVLGLGGVGSACAEALARGGVGNLIVVDRDTVEESNINRQAVAYMSTLGQPKAEVMERIIADINPDCQVTAAQMYLTKEDVGTVLEEFPRPHYVLDCIDTVSQKLAVAQWCAQQNIPLLSSMGAANRLDPTLLKFAKIEKTLNCPLSRDIRHECKRRGIRGLEVLFSTEVAFKVDKAPGAMSKGETLGSMSYMPPIMGKMMAGLVIRRLAGFESIPTPPRYRPRRA
ncbi:tRNA threonylcarbamoyladenosine dehydratase [Corynebacterium anserum]|uniref:tRNA threonylcarbamoyladenosine dehydratase n=1 Tax=Corynebacterium anserum TaxID=2684406 RepID=A0A7G7YMD0_9CORY|nr:tRNA threonylcarbamoyladenosine dehydratase [Corynebacterium anserum]MBC2681011.1 tRNA threonylcarbamoyladenosine dehydratase [Corynebacterium anserum]QNH95650.1 tRNA threonylcarbamoyladenosine dehydratase [Corynebacterium anserum]